MKKPTVYWKWIRTHLSIGRALVVAFLAIMLFVDDNSMLKRHEYNQKIKQTRKEIRYYQQMIEESGERLNELNTDEENLEKFGREQYLMKRPNEDIYVIER